MLAFLVFGAVLLKEAHHLLGHNHEEHLHCTAANDEVHFHSADYLHNDCLLCFFNFSPSEETVTHFKVKEIIPQPFVAIFLYENNFSTSSNLTIRLRGPPSV
ncbi:MAG: hypothetical protein ACI9XO_000108 [Paraglaciecola sp.]